MFILIFILNLL